MNTEEALYQLGRAVLAYRDKNRGTRSDMYHELPSDCRLDDGMTPDISRAEVAGILREHILCCYAEHFDDNANLIITEARIDARRDYVWMWEVKSYSGILLASGGFEPLDGLIYESALVAAIEALD